jgi:hypothetical protein
MNSRNEQPMPSAAVSRTHLYIKASGLIRPDAWWVREESAAAGDWVVHAQVIEYAARMATAEEDEASTRYHGAVVAKEAIRGARHVGKHMVLEKR